MTTAPKPGIAVSSTVPHLPSMYGRAAATHMQTYQAVTRHDPAQQPVHRLHIVWRWVQGVTTVFIPDLATDQVAYELQCRIRAMPCASVRTDDPGSDSGAIEVTVGRCVVQADNNVIPLGQLVQLVSQIDSMNASHMRAALKHGGAPPTKGGDINTGAWNALGEQPDRWREKDIVTNMARGNHEDRCQALWV